MSFKASQEFAAALLVGSLVAWPVAAPAQQSGLPPKVQILVGVAAGGPNDAIARMIAQRFSSKYGITAIVVNQVGANGMLAGQTLVNSPPNGETLLIASQGLITVSPHLTTMPFDPRKDFTPISSITTTDVGLCIGANVPANNMKEFVAYAKQKTSPITLGSAGVGNITHLMMEKLSQVADFRFTHIPYKGIAPALQDVIGGHIEGTLCALVIGVPLLKAGKIKIVGMLGEKRSKLLPDIPTTTEQGYAMPDDTWYGMFAPPRMNPALAQQIFNAFKNVASDPEMEREFAKVGLDMWIHDPTTFAQIIRDESERWGKLIRDNNIKAP